MLPDQIFTMMDSTDFEEHMLLSALEDVNNDHDPLPITNKSLSMISTATAATVDTSMDEQDLDSFTLFDTDGVGVEMVIDNDAKPPARVIEENAKKNAAKKPPTSPKNMNHSSEAYTVDMPGKFDVLCGQSRVCASHSGNKRFQIVLDMFAPRYDAATSKQEKMTMTKEIVKSIQSSGGRFLKYKDGHWLEISDVTARDKASHALRTKAASMKRQRADRAEGKKSRPTHRRSRRASDSSITSSATDIVAESFDSNNPISPNVMSELVKHQRAFLAQAEENGEFLHPLKALSK
ncbi:MAG: hypothetical protein SGILL_002526 [Bacillariaceae sp.]